MKNEIRKYLRTINPKILGLDGISRIEIDEIGLGESNLNYLAMINGKKFNIRINADSKSTNKSRREFEGLRVVERFNIAPKAFHYEHSKKYLGGTFIIIEYLDGKSLDKCKVDNHTIKELAKVVAQLHDIPTVEISKSLGMHYASKDEILESKKQMIDYIRKKNRELGKPEAWFCDLLTETYNGFDKQKFKMKRKLAIGHGDIAPQNVILNDGKLKLIDWEDLGIMETAWDLAILFESFFFSSRQKELFLKEYLNIRNDPALRQRVELLRPIQFFGTFCWSVMHVFEIEGSGMHKEFVKRQKLKEHIDYAKETFDRCKRERVFGRNVKFVMEDIFPRKYLLQD